MEIGTPAYKFAFLQIRSPVLQSPYAVLPGLSDAVNPIELVALLIDFSVTSQIHLV